ncbi:MAG: hypothetical protein AAGN82_25225 [Myxococcota bacterium]
MDDGLYRTPHGLFLRHDGEAFGPLDNGEALRLSRVAPRRGMGERPRAVMPAEAEAVDPAHTPPSVTTYELHGAPESIPVDWTRLPAGRRHDVCAAAGLDPRDEGLPTGRLREDWNLHPAGSPVVTTILAPGHRLSVVDEPG